MAVDENIRIALIAAVANNGTIGRNNALPWRIPGDLKYFKQQTMGKKIIMGRKTFESLGRPLPGRKHIVVTRNQSWHCDSQDVDIVHSVGDALALAVRLSARDNNSEVMVIGGEQIYREALVKADRLYITRVLADVEGDATFPDLNTADWREQQWSEYRAQGPNEYNYAFTVLDRLTPFVVQ